MLVKRAGIACLFAVSWQRYAQIYSDPFPDNEEIELVSLLVGALSPVNHKGLYQG